MSAPSSVGWEGWIIRYTFLGGNIGAETDVRGSCERYRAAIKDALAKLYPGAMLVIGFEVNASGAAPLPVVLDPEGNDCPPELDRVWEITERAWVECMESGAIR